MIKRSSRSLSFWVKFLFRPLHLLALALVLLLSWQTIATAQDTSFLSSRVSRVESETSALRSRLSQLESQVSRLSSNAGIGYATPSEVDIPQPSVSSSDPMFDRLATLAIELKERIVVLEEQVADLQTRVPQ
ncbi:hypothetical protein [Thermocoleostomius sinensis]|uniref:Uncharacterized protein n=1 Tax=Thermocoleostomius sinensis A174 TaxID=2016057 RepID=A0A9E9C415_9CYAN|nr:hypothetical protein [Thermocoleostomius sinensis]WAL59536.1 hypothetical protein OXH18_20540 [Thermocoleostomius sinensis A174]